MVKNIIFDFDGVILDSMPIREFGFRQIFKDFPKDRVEKLIEFHRKNGGWSRFIKIRYFFENIMNIEISEKEVLEYGSIFSDIMKKELANSKYLIPETIEFIEKSYQKYNLHIASGSEERELQYLCKNLEIEKYFISINGSPTPKEEIVKTILDKYKYSKEETILIGDSINDYQASQKNAIKFYGFNNQELKEIEDIEYLETIPSDWE